MFNYFDYFNKGFIFGVGKNKYSPYINYSWSQTLTVGGNQQIKDTGTSGLNLQQFFGQGCWFNGIDMQITIPINATIQTEIKRVNGVVEINTNTQNLTNYNVYSGTGAKVYKDLYMFNRVLTQTEIDKYNNQPNQFFMDSLEDNSCVLAMPMCEKDRYIRNYKNYSEIPQTITYTTLNGWVDNEDFTYSVNKDTGWWYLYRDTNLPNGLYYVSFEVTSITSGRVQFDNEVDANFSATTQGLFKGIIEIKSNKLKFTTVGSTGGIATVRNLEVKQLTSTYPIANYLTTCRTNAQRLSYGLQTSGFKRDSNGLILSKSNFLEADGVGYGDTGWIADTTNDFSIECVFNRLLNTYDVIFGTGIGLASDFRFRADSTKFTFTFGSPTKTINSPSATGSHLVSVIYKADTKTYIMFIDGVLIDSQSGIEVTNSASVVGLLSNSRGTPTPSSTGTSARLFKVHQKALTQEEITKNFNKYQS